MLDLIVAVLLEAAEANCQRMEIQVYSVVCLLQASNALQQTAFLSQDESKHDHKM